MSLLAPGWLLLGALMIVVLALHMRRRRQIDVPSLMLWRLLESSATPRRSLRWPQPSLLLLLQLLIILLIAVALAQPLFGINRTSLHTIYVLDASGSMRATDLTPSRFGAAVARLGKLIETSSMRRDNRVSVITAGAQPQVHIARQLASTKSVPTIEALRAGDGSADWHGAVALIAALVGDDEKPAIVVLTDGADTGDTALAEAFPDLSVTRTILAGTGVANVGLTAEATPADTEPGYWDITGTVRFANSDAEQVTVQALFQPEGGDGFVAWSEIEVPRRDSEDVDFSLTLELPGSGTILLQLPEDAGPHDNTVYFVLHRDPISTTVLYLGNMYRPLIAALQSLNNVEVTAADQLPANDNVYDLVIIDGVAVSRRPMTNVLWLGPAHITDQPTPSLTKAPYITGWNQDHPLSDGVDWTAVTPQNGYLVTRLPGAAVLTESGGVPLVQARTTPEGREVQISFDLKDSGWVERADFPIFVINLVSWLGIEPGRVSGPSCIVGAPCPIESRLLRAHIFSPDGTEAWSPVQANAEFLLPEIANTFIPDRAGIYRLQANGENRLLPTNTANKGETLLAPRDGEMMGVPATGILPWIWWWLLAGVLLLLLTEAWIAGSGPEQFLRPTALAKDNPLALRRRLQLGVRSAGCLLLVAALLGLPMPTREQSEMVVMIIGNDLGPANSNPERERTLHKGTSNRAAMMGGKSVGIVATGATNRVAADTGNPSAPVPADAFHTPAPGANLEQALELAAAMIPNYRSGRLVLATDGNETMGKIARSLDTLQTRGLAVDVEPLAELPSGEVLVESINVPARVYSGDSFRLDAVVYSQASGLANVTIKRAGKIVQEKEVELLSGRNRVETVILADEPGHLLLEVSVTMARDKFSQNNTAGAHVNVGSTPTIVIITPQATAGEYLAQALEVQDLSASVISPSEAPHEMDGWLEYDSVVLMNVPAITLNTDQQEMLEKLVEVHGRGLLILGGENSFGPGGYFETPFERVSPLSSRVPHEAPRVALVYVLDRSGSMVGAVDEAATATRLQVAKQATLSAVSLLNDVSQVGIVVFDTKANVILPLQEHKNEAGVIDALELLVAGGGTSIFPGLKMGIDMLVGVDAATRHIVVMTDGLSRQADFAPLLARAAAANITISAISIGGAADVRVPRQIAQHGGGAFYATEDFKALPSILAQETLMLASSPVQQRSAPVSWVNRNADFLAGLPDMLPSVHGYVRTTLQPEANLHLTLTEEDGETTPLLASWRYGNGQVLAFATHGAGAGTEEWTQIPEYPLMWAQVIRHFLPDARGPGLHVRLHRGGDSVQITADVLDEDGAPMEGRAVVATITADAETTINLDEKRPGRYLGDFSVSKPGAYRVDVRSDNLEQEAMVHIAYPARFNFVRSDFDKLYALAGATGGKMLLGDNPVLGGKMEWATQREWRLWALAALVLFMLDLSIRHVPGVFGLSKGPRPRRQHSKSP